MTLGALHSRHIAQFWFRPSPAQRSDIVLILFNDESLQTSSANPDLCEGVNAVGTSMGCDSMFASISELNYN